MKICKYALWMKKIILTIIFLLFTQTTLAASIFDDLKKSKKASYLDFILLKIEQRLIQRHGLLGVQPTALRIQYQSIGSQIDFSEKESKITISIIGIMDKNDISRKNTYPGYQIATYWETYFCMANMDIIYFKNETNF